jgi:hypothetical protein
MSGYAADIIVHRGTFDKEVQLIRKPPSIDALSRKQDWQPAFEVAGTRRNLVDVPHFRFRAPAATATLAP